MEGKIFDGVISSQMKFKKRLFPDKPLERRLDKFSPQNNSAQIQGMKKRNHEIFWGFPKSGDEILENNFFQKFFFFS